MCVLVLVVVAFAIRRVILLSDDDCGAPSQVLLLLGFVWHPVSRAGDNGGPPSHHGFASHSR